MSGVVYYRFKHQKALDRIEFSSSEISVAELKLKIIEKLALVEKHAHVSAIDLYRPTSVGDDGVMTKYELDSELIPSHTAVVVFRTPSKFIGSSRITVEGKDLFVPQHQVDPLALKQSILADESNQLKRVPEGLICTVCQKYMIGDHRPVILHCCGVSLCVVCAAGRCPVCSEANSQHTLNRALLRLAETVLRFKDLFGWGADVLLNHTIIPEVLVSDEHVDDSEVVDLEDDVVDVDKPLTAKELALIERRERRKRKAVEILLKKEGRLVKGELTEEQITKLFKTESALKHEDDLFKHEESEQAKNLFGPVIVEFPKLLTPQEFSQWTTQIGR